MKKILFCILFLVILTIGCNKPGNNEPVYNWNIYLVNGEILKAYEYNTSDGWLHVASVSSCACTSTVYPQSQVLKIEKIKK